MNRLGQIVDGMQDAIDPEPHHGDTAFRLDMDIAGPLLQGVVEHVVDRRS